jgi:sugar phosphate isomerase/epimerase
MTFRLSGFGDEIHPDPVVQLSVLQALGIGHIEVRSAWRTNVIALTDQQLGQFATLLREHEIAVSAIASPVGKVDVFEDPALDLGRLHRAIKAAHFLGTQKVRIFSFYRPEHTAAHEVRDLVMRRLREFADLAEAEKVVLLHENEKDIYGDVPSRILDLVQSVGSPALRLAWDSANFVQCGVKPFTDGYEMLRQHIDYLQVKDALAATGEVVPAGLGDGELAETLAALRDDGYDGFASLEPHLEGRPGPAAFGIAARAFTTLTQSIGVATQ